LFFCSQKASLGETNSIERYLAKEMIFCPLMVVSILGNHLMEKLYLSTGITLHGIGQSSNVPG
jgi:hypothetical protein